MTYDDKTAQRISVSASFNRAAEIVAQLSIGKTYDNISKDVAFLGRLIFQQEQKLLAELEAQDRIKANKGTSRVERKEKAGFEPRDEVETDTPPDQLL